MPILLVDGDAVRARRVAGDLRHALGDVRVQTIALAVRGLAGAAPGMVFVCPVAPEASLPDLARQVRGRLAGAERALLAVTEPARSDLAEGLEAGVDVALVAPVAVGRLAAQVRALLKVRGVPLEVLARPEPEEDPEVALSELPDPASPEVAADQLAASPGWLDFGCQVPGIIADTYGLAELRRRRVRELSEQSASSVTMLHDERLGVLLTLAVTMREGHLAQLRPLVRDPQMIDFELFYDAAGELTNVLAGKLKRALVGEGLLPQQLLPRPASHRELSERIAQARHHWSLLLHNADLSVTVSLLLEPFVGKCLPPRRLKPTGTLARDVLTERGVLLVAAGAALDEATVARLKSSVPDQTFAVAS